VVRKITPAEVATIVTPETFGLSGQSTPLVVVEAYAVPAELLSQNAIFFAKIVDDQQLTLVHPAGDGDQHEPKWIQHSRHVGLPPQPCGKEPD
jgi:hypothetical protein